MSKHYNNYSKYSQKAIRMFDDLSEEKPVVQEEVVEEEPKNSPEEKPEKVKKVLPEKGTLTVNLYVREKPYGDKAAKDSFDRLVASKLISDNNGDAIVPKDTVVDIYDMVDHEDGSIWYGTRFGYLMAKHKDGRQFIK